MPKPFDDCVKSGGKVRTMKMPKSRYMRICIKGGKTFRGEIKKRKTK